MRRADRGVRRRACRFALAVLLAAAPACGADEPAGGAPGDDYATGAPPEPAQVVIDAEQIALAGIELETVGPARIREHVALSGRVVPDADALVHVAPRFPGVVRSVHKRLGDPVARGDLLAVIESNESLHPYELRAPLAGTVIARDLAPGEFVASDREVFVIADLSSVWVELDVHRMDAARLRVGQSVRIEAGDGGPPVETTIAYLAPVVSEESQTLRARAVLANPEQRWRPGLFVAAEVEVSAEEVPVTVAREAIQRLDGREVVFVEEGEGSFRAQPVVLGRSDAQRSEVRAGLAAGERVVARGSFVVKAELGKAEAAHDH